MITVDTTYRRPDRADLTDDQCDELAAAARHLGRALRADELQAVLHRYEAMATVDAQQLARIRELQLTIQHLTAMPASGRFRELLALFELASRMSADVSLYEDEEPEAPAALRAWASVSNRSVVELDHGVGLATLSVESSARRMIRVHLKPT